MKKLLLFFAALLTVILFVNACGSNEAGPVPDIDEALPDETKSPEQEGTINEDLPSLAGICLDDAAEIVDMILGDEYEESISEIEGHFGEPYYIRDYKDGLSIIIGQNSGKVLEIELSSTKYETWLGDKIGDTAEKVLSKYREKFTEPESIHTGGKLEGWFNVGSGIILIFDFNKEDNMIVNTDIKPDSQVELIKLTKMQYLD